MELPSQRSASIGRAIPSDFHENGPAKCEILRRPMNVDELSGRYSSGGNSRTYGALPLMEYWPMLP